MSATLAYVEVKDGNLERALRKFKKKVERYGILEEYKERQAYIKPSDKKRLKRKGR